MSAAHSATVVYVLRAVEPAPELGLEPGEQLVVWSDGTADRVRRGTVHEGAIRRALGTGSLTLEAPDSAILEHLVDQQRDTSRRASLSLVP